MTNASTRKQGPAAESDLRGMIVPEPKWNRGPAVAGFAEDCPTRGTQSTLKDKAGVMLTRIAELWIAVRMEDVRANPDAQR